mgnify:FL=1
MEVAKQTPLKHELVVMRHSNVFYELFLTCMLLAVTSMLILTLYDRATTPSCTISESLQPQIPKDWMVQPPDMHVRP